MILEHIIMITLVPCIPFFIIWPDFTLLFLSLFGPFIVFGTFFLAVGFYYFKERSYFILYGLSLGLAFAIIYLLFSLKFIPSYRYWQILLIGLGFGLFYSSLILLDVRYRSSKHFNKEEKSNKKSPSLQFILYLLITFILFVGGIFYWLTNHYPLQQTLILKPNTVLNLSYFRPIEGRFPTLSLNFKNQDFVSFKEESFLQLIEIKASIDNKNPKKLSLYSDTSSRINLYIKQEHKHIPFGFHHITLNIESLPETLVGKEVIINFKPILTFKFVSNEPLYKLLRLWIFWPTLLGMWILLSLWMVLHKKNCTPQLHPTLL